MRSLIIWMLLMVVLVAPSIAQLPNSLYFIENTPQRNTMNPAFVPQDKWYVSLPVIGDIGLAAGNNAVMFRDIIFRDANNSTVTFLKNQTSVDRFFKLLNPSNIISLNKEVNIIGLGHGDEFSYWHFSVSQKTRAGVSLSKDIFGLLLYGTNQLIDKNFSFSGTTADVSDYYETALGYSLKFTDKLTLGAKAKLLLGINNLSVHNRGASITSEVNHLALNTDLRYRTSGDVSMIQNISDRYYLRPINFAKPGGLGVAFDLGADYRLSDNIRLSAALVDLGFIRWNNHVLGTDVKAAYQFNGVADIDFNADPADLNQRLQHLTSYQNLSDSLLNAFNSAVSIADVVDVPYSTLLRTQLNVGFEYLLPEKALSVGVVSSTRLYGKSIDEEITVSLNYRPEKWMNAALTYSALKGRSSMGAAIGLKLGIINFFAAADYIPFQKKEVAIAVANGGTFMLPLPYSSMYFNVRTGINIAFNQFHPKPTRYRKHCNCEEF